MKRANYIFSIPLFIEKEIGHLQEIYPKIILEKKT